MSRPTTPVPPSHSGADETSSKADGSSTTKSSSFPHRPGRPHLHGHHLRHHHHHQHNEDKLAPQSAAQPASHHPFGEFLSKTVSRTLPESAIIGLSGVPPTSQAHMNQNASKSSIHGHHSGGHSNSAHHSASTHDNARPPPLPDRPDASSHLTNLTSPPASASASTSAVAAGGGAHIHAIDSKAKWNQVNRLRSTRHKIEADLQHSVRSLSQLSTATTRRLDYTYYSLLSNLDTLHSGISTLHSLATATHTQRDHFTSLTADVTGETVMVINTASMNFDRQATRIATLEARLRAARERAKTLTDRMSKVGDIVEEWSARESEERRRREGWWKGVMGVFGTLVGVLCVLMFIKVGVREHFLEGEGGGGARLMGDVAGHETNFWEQEMENGTIGADGLKVRLEELREATGGWEDVVGGRSPILKSNDDEVLEKTNHQEEGGEFCSKTDGEATLRLFDEL